MNGIGRAIADHLGSYPANHGYEHRSLPRPALEKSCRNRVEMVTFREKQLQTRVFRIFRVDGKNEARQETAYTSRSMAGKSGHSEKKQTIKHQ